jgi:hypothetical protein
MMKCKTQQATEADQQPATQKKGKSFEDLSLSTTH